MKQIFVVSLSIAMGLGMSASAQTQSLPDQFTSNTWCGFGRADQTPYVLKIDKSKSYFYIYRAPGNAVTENPSRQGFYKIDGNDFVATATAPGGASVQMTFPIAQIATEGSRLVARYRNGAFAYECNGEKLDFPPAH